MFNCITKEQLGLLTYLHSFKFKTMTSHILHFPNIEQRKQGLGLRQQPFNALHSVNTDTLPQKIKV